MTKRSRRKVVFVTQRYKAGKTLRDLHPEVTYKQKDIRLRTRVSFQKLPAVS
jgi:hypothetical protein